MEQLRGFIIILLCIIATAAEQATMAPSVAAANAGSNDIATAFIIIMVFGCIGILIKACLTPDKADK